MIYVNIGNIPIAEYRFAINPIGTFQYCNFTITNSLALGRTTKWNKAVS